MTRLLLMPLTLMAILLLTVSTADLRHKPAIERSAGCIPDPLHPCTPAPLLLSTTCNRPASDMPPAPDGCPDYVPIASPGAPIPPPCITALQADPQDEEDAAVTELTIYVDHPELGQGVRTFTQLTRIQHSAFSIPHSEWELVDASWEASCGKDEGPLVWALLEVLNAGRWDALSIYTSPLPAEYMAVLRELAGLRNFTYLPYLEVQP